MERPMKKVLLAGVFAGAMGSLALGGTAKAETINIYGWLNNAAPSLLGTITAPSAGCTLGNCTLTVTGTPLGGFNFNNITNSTLAPTVLDLADSINLSTTAAAGTVLHLVSEVVNATSPPFLSGNLQLTSGFAASSLIGVSATESTHLGTLLGANSLIATQTFGPGFGQSASSTDSRLVPNPGSWYDQFDLTVGNTSCSVSACSANVNISLVAAVPGPVAGAGLPGLIAACGGLLALARRRRRNKAAPV
jgi:hypothetical protein